MKTDICKLMGRESDIEDVLNEVEKVAEYGKLTQRQAIQLRLLTEETIGIEKGILGFTKGEIYIESAKNVYSIVLKMTVKTDIFSREQFISIATNGKNDSYRGFIGKIRFVADVLTASPALDAPEGSMMAGMVDYYNSGYDSQMGMWSFSQSQDSVRENEEVWDEMEKSIVANLADDIRISAGNNEIRVTVIKEFK